MDDIDAISQVDSVDKIKISKMKICFFFFFWNLC
jgi:hypothetical protein